MSQLLRQARRRLVVEAVNAGATLCDAAARYCVSLRSVQRWVRACRFGSVEAVAARPIPGRSRKLNDLQRSQLAQAMLSAPRFAGYQADKWTQVLVARLIADLFGVHYSRGHIGALLRTMSRPPPPPPNPDWQFNPNPPFPPPPAPPLVDQPS